MASHFNREIDFKIFENEWKNNKNQKKIILAFLAFLLFIALYSLIIISVKIAFKQSYFDFLLKNSKNNNINEENVAGIFFGNYLATNTIIAIGFLISFYLIFKSYVISIKKNSFHLLSNSSKIIFFIFSFVSFYNVYLLFKGISEGFNNVLAGDIMDYFYIILLVAYGFLLKQYDLIRNKYFKIYVEENARILSEELARNLASGSMSNNFVPFDQFISNMMYEQQRRAQSGSQTNRTYENFDQQKSQVPSEEKDEQIKKLNNLSRENLNKIAEKLEIFGYESMNKDELVEKIYRIYLAQKTENSN